MSLFGFGAFDFLEQVGARAHQPRIVARGAARIVGPVGIGSLGDQQPHQRSVAAVHGGDEGECERSLEELLQERWKLLQEKNATKMGKGKRERRQLRVLNIGAPSLMPVAHDQKGYSYSYNNYCLNTIMLLLRHPVLSQNSRNLNTHTL